MKTASLVVRSRHHAGGLCVKCTVAYETPLWRVCRDRPSSQTGSGTFPCIAVVVPAQWVDLWADKCLVHLWFGAPCSFKTNNQYLIVSSVFETNS